MPRAKLGFWSLVTLAALLGSTACGVKAPPLPPLPATPQQSERNQRAALKGEVPTPVPSPSRAPKAAARDQDAD